MSNFKESFEKRIQVAVIVILGIVIIIGNVINFNPAMFTNEFSLGNVVISLIIMSMWCLVFYCNSRFNTKPRKVMKYLANFFLIMAALIIIAYLFSLIDLLNPLALVIMLIPQVLFLIPLAGLEMPIWIFIEDEVICYDFVPVPFLIGTIFIILLYVLNILIFKLTKRLTKEKK